VRVITSRPFPMKAEYVSNFTGNSVGFLLIMTSYALFDVNIDLGHYLIVYSIWLCYWFNCI